VREATTRGGGGRGARVQAREWRKIFLSCQSPRPAVDSLCCFCCYPGLSTGGKAAGREATDFPPSGHDSKHVWSHTYTPSYSLTLWCLITHSSKLTSTLHCVLTSTRVPPPPPAVCCSSPCRIWPMSTSLKIYIITTKNSIKATLRHPTGCREVRRGGSNSSRDTWRDAVVPGTSWPPPLDKHRAAYNVTRWVSAPGCEVEAWFCQSGASGGTTVTDITHLRLPQ
jgi:hypothetical protein